MSVVSAEPPRRRSRRRWRRSARWPRVQPDPARARRSSTTAETPVSAFLKLARARPGVPARVGRAGPGRALLVHRHPPAQGAALVARGSRRSVRAGRRPSSAATGAAPLAGLPPFAGGAVGMFAYDLVRTVEPLGAPNPDPIGVPDLALMLTDALVVFDHLKHTITVLANVYADEDLDASYARRAGDDRRDPLAAGRRRCRGRPRRPRRRPRGADVQLEHVARASSRRWWRGSSSTSTPATPTRSCPRSAGRRRSRSRRSRSTGACARSTPARTCTSWTSATSRSPAPARSR